MQVRPYPKDDPSFDPNDIKFSCIKYACTMGENLSSSTRVDPRSGEILSATICIPHNVATGSGPISSCSWGPPIPRRAA